MPEYLYYRSIQRLRVLSPEGGVDAVEGDGFEWVVGLEGIGFDHGVVEDAGAAPVVFVVDPPAGDNDDRGDEDVMSELAGEPFLEESGVSLRLVDGFVGGAIGEYQPLAIVGDLVLFLLVGVEGLAPGLGLDDEHPARPGDDVVDVELLAHALEDEVMVNTGDFGSAQLPIERLANVALAIEAEVELSVAMQCIA